MTYGFDYYDTITKYRKEFRKLLTDLKASGNTVYIVSAVKRVNTQRLKDSVRHSKVPHDELHIVIYDNYTDVAALKLDVCKRLGIRCFFDDREDVCRILAAAGIITCQVR